MDTHTDKVRILKGTRVYGYDGKCHTKWSTHKVQPDEVVVLESLQGLLSQPLPTGYLMDQKSISVPCRPMGKILPGGHHSHLFGV